MRSSISNEERDLLLAHSETKEEALKLLVAGGKLELEGTEDQFDELRNACSDLLLRIGFNKNYETTREGDILELLIDRFLV